MNQQDQSGEMTMDRSITTGPKAQRLALIVSTALAGLALAGCSTTAAPRADVSFSSAQVALGKGQVDKAISHAEAAVMADPRNPGFRALLGAAYLEAGRFDAAATSFGDALELGDENPRTVLSFALAKIALGHPRAATAALDEFAKVIDPADMGLALALAGQPERGVHVLVNAIRMGEPNPKLRQNLAYTYALAGNWPAARVMAAEDVPAGQVEQRLAQWGAMAAPEMYQQRVAALLDVTPRGDAGQPQRLALANFPAQDVMVAEAAAQADAPALAEAPAPVLMAEAPAASGFAEAFAATARPIERVDPSPPAMAAGPRFVSNPVVQPLPYSAAAPRVAGSSTQKRMAATSAASTPAPVAAPPAPLASAAASDKNASTHLVQLGSYDSKAEATRGWATLKSRFPQLGDHDVVITEAVVNGRTFWRVAAAGFGPKSAQSLCGTVKSAGRGCFAYAASSPPAGAIKRDVQMAARTR
jgi:Flp pilus assembly protein TadD